MFNKLLLTVLLCSLMVAITAADLDTIFAQHQQPLKTIWRTSLNVQQGAEDCFDWYFQAMDDNINIYRKNVAKCNDTAAAEIKSLNAQGSDTRDNFIERKRTVCRSLQRCEENSDLLQFYDCYQNVSSQSIAIIYNLSTDSKIEYNKLSGEYNNVHARKNVCDECAREEYIKNSAATDKQFQDCRAGIGGVPTKPTTATTATTTVIYETETSEGTTDANIDN